VVRSTKILTVTCDNGNELEVISGEFYVKVRVGKKCWYWNKKDGKFDGTGTYL